MSLLELVSQTCSMDFDDWADYGTSVNYYFLGARSLNWVVIERELNLRLFPFYLSWVFPWKYSLFAMFYT